MIISVVILGIGARLGDPVVPLLVSGALGLLGVSLWRPAILEAVIGRRTSGRSQRMAAPSLWQLAVVLAVMAAIYLFSVGPDTIGGAGVALTP